EVEGQDLALVSALDPLVEALPGLFAQELPLDHPRDEIRDAKQIAPLVMRQGSFEVPDHVEQHVEPDDIERAEGGGFWQAHRRSGEGVDFVDRVAALPAVRPGHSERVQRYEGTDAGVQEVVAVV